MLLRQFTTRILKPADLPPTSPAMRVVGVFNPGAETFGNGVALIARVVEQVVEERAGYLSSPRYDDTGLAVDWLVEERCDCSDPRLYVDRGDASVRLRFVSHLRVFISADGRTIDHSAPAVTILPEGPY